jgi:uncharacterized Zn finger protein
VLDLRIARGEVVASVMGSRIYTVTVKIRPVSKARWDALCKGCAGGIDSVVELLQGRFSEGVMAPICAPDSGLFPAPSEIEFDCTCPDWASMCKHVAAALYGIGARLDREPELLFTLRKVKQEELISRAGSGAALTRRRTRVTRRRTIDESSLAEVFGLEIAPRIDRGSKRRGARPRHR